MKQAAFKDYLTVLNVVSAISVVALHANGCFWQFSRNGGYWFSANIMECLFYFAVPIFIMVSGITLFDYTKRYSTTQFLSRRFYKTVLPFVFWSIIALVAKIFFTKQISLSEISLVFVVNGIFKASFNTQYWFFPPLFSLYLCIPLFASVEENKKVSTLKFLVAVGFVINFLLPFIFNVFKIPIKIPVSVTVTSGFLFYATLGWLLDRVEISAKQRRTIYILSLVGLMMHICGTYILSMEAGKIIKTFKGYHNVPCILYATGIFIFIKHKVSSCSPRVNNYLLKTCKILQNYTFPIYLLHGFFIRILVKVLHIDTKTMLWRIGGTFLLILLSVMATWLIRKIPLIGKRVLP